ncbi:MAG: ATP-binding protein [Firmicutes bacterium]|nr:ATP-binding protein [Bacillota bacterium]
MPLNYFIALALTITGMIYLMLGTNTYVTDTKSHMRRRYIITCIWLAIWSFSYALMTLTHSEELVRLFWSIGFFATFMFFPSWVNFLYYFTSQKWHRAKQIMPLLYLGAIVIAVITICSGTTEFVKTEFGYQFIYEISPIFIIVNVYVIILASLMLYMQMQWMRSSRFVRQKKTAFIYFLSSIIILPPAHILEGIIPIYFNSSAVPFATVLLLFVSVQFYRAARTNKALDISLENVSQDIFTSVTMPVLVLNYNNDVVLANSAAKRLWENDIIGCNAVDLFLVGNTNPESSFFDENLENSRITIATVSGNINCKMLLTIVKDMYGDVLNKIITVSDITELLNAIEKADLASKAKSSFLANMSHEIRTPLNAITGMTELALREDIDSVSREYIKTIKQASSNLLSIVNDILDFSKIETGKLEILTSEYSVPSLINDVVGTIRIETMDLPIRFFVYVDKNIPHTLIGDEMKIRQALINVLGNAVKYTEQGFVSLSVSGEFLQDDIVCLTMDVVDSGKGIRQENIGSLFDDFARFDTESNRSIDGMGLGLAITKNIIDTMNGDIFVESEYGKGSTFTIKFPQEYKSRMPIVTIQNPDDVSVLIYENCEKTSDSLSDTFINLGVRYTIASTESDLHRLVMGHSFDFLFVSHRLYKQCEGLITKYKGSAKVVLLMEFDETISEPVLNNNVEVIVLPAYSIPIANIINGISGSFIYEQTKKPVVTFTASGANVLLVDDIKTNLQVAKGLLQPYCMRIDLCSSGNEAIKALEKKNYDIVFMDHKMPDMDGVETTQRIREMGVHNKYYKDVPIIALTANAITGVNEMFLSSGFNDFLSKPIDVIRLNKVLERWIPKDKQKKVTNKSIAPARAEGGVILIDGLDVDTGISRTGGTIEFYIKCLSVFCDDGYKKIKEIEESLSNGDITLFVIHVHGLKSASAFIGADWLSRAASALEEAGKREDIAFIKLNTNKFLLSMKSLLDSISDWKNKRSSS